MARSTSRTAAQHSFARIEGPEIQRSSFNRSHGLKTTFDFGNLIPVFWDEALPGDTIKMRMHSFGRLATPLHPVLDNMFIDTHFFAVPYRLIWDNWEKFNGAQDNPGDSTDFTIPQISLTGPQILPESIYDYMGLPTGTIDPISVSSLYLRAYNLIWNTWFRSQDLQDSIQVKTHDGPDFSTDYSLLRRGKRHDYFTSGLPFPQKGESILLPLGDSAPVVSAGDGIPTFDVDNQVDVSHQSLGGAGSVQFSANPQNSGADAKWNQTKLETDLTAATATTINQVRQAFQIQRLLERDARGGTRYVEMIKAHFGVTSPDFRLQRPEFLGGGTQVINTTPVPQTSADEVGGGADTPQGNLAAFGTTTGSNGFIKSFDEHCIIIGLVSARADLNYQQGIPRQYLRKTRYDFYLPALSHLGEQAILNEEIFATGEAADKDVFAYQERWAEYRYKPSSVTALMRSAHPQSLDTWHLAQEFANRPVLNSEFIEEAPPVDRIIAVQDEPHMLFDAFFQFTHARPMPTFSTPGMIDHF